MKVLTYASYKEHCDLCTKIYGSIAVNDCQVGLAQKEIILLSKTSLIVYKAGKKADVTNTEFIRFTVSEGTYSIDDFNSKIKVAVLQQRQGWEAPQIKDLRLVIPNEYFFMADNTIFIALGIPDKHLEKTVRVRSTMPPCSYKISLDISLPPKILSLDCKQINKFKNELDGQPSSFLTSMHVFNYNATFSSAHLVFLELDIYQPHHLDFKILDENNNEVTLRTFYLQLLNKK